MNLQFKLNGIIINGIHLYKDKGNYNSEADSNDRSDGLQAKNYAI